MAVVINDFELVNEQSQGGRSASGETEPHGERQDGNAPSMPTPHDLRRILCRAIERLERIRAH
jgi:hypothetical protein